MHARPASLVAGRMAAVATSRSIGVAANPVVLAIGVRRTVLVAIDARELLSVGRVVVAIEAVKATVPAAVDRELVLPVAAAPAARAVALLA